MIKRARRGKRGPAEEPAAVEPAHGDRRAHTREKARELREQSRKQERRTRWLVAGGVGLTVAVAVAAVVFVLLTSPRPSSAGPANMISDGIKIGENLEAELTPGLRPSATPMPAPPNPEGVLEIKVFVDYLCPLCSDFHLTNEAYIKSLLNQGAATIEIHPIGMLDRLSAGTRYSSRAANAAACVANYSPHEFFAFHSLLLEHQPEPETPGLSDQAMIEMARTAGVEKASRIATCIETQEFKIWVENAKKRALSEPVPGTSLDKIEGVPTILIDGQLYNYTLDEQTRRFNTAEFQAFVNDVLGMQFSESVKPSPSPSPSSDMTRP